MDAILDLRFNGELQHMCCYRNSRRQGGLSGVVLYGNEQLIKGNLWGAALKDEIAATTFCPRPWPPAMAQGYGLRPWPKAIAFGHGLRPWPKVMAFGHGPRPWPKPCMAFGNGPRPWPMAMASGHGHKLFWRVHPRGNPISKIDLFFRHAYLCVLYAFFSP